MNKCLRIILTARLPSDLLHDVIQKHARKLRLEGVAQMIDPKSNQVRITVCGSNSDLDQFVDVLHDVARTFDISNMEIEPFLKDRDYRSVFRVID